MASTTLSWDTCPKCQTNQAAISLSVTPARTRVFNIVFFIPVGFLMVFWGIVMAFENFWEVPPIVAFMAGLVGVAIGLVTFRAGVMSIRRREIKLQCSGGHSWSVWATRDEQEQILTEGLHLVGADAVHR